MIPISYVVGDATDPQVPGPKIIAHICNDIGVWGAGFVMALSGRWDSPEEQYRLWWKHRCPQNPFELGYNQLVPIGPSYSPNIDLWVVNMIAQRGIRTTGDGPPIRYGALEQCLSKLATMILHSSSCRYGLLMAHASVHMPRIGCGLAGGQWTLIEPIIHQTLSINNVPVYVYDLP